MSTTAITISVTQEDIDEGERGDCFNCAVAKAIERAVPNSWPRVNAYSTWLGPALPAEGRSSITMPPVATRFIRDFDHGYSVTPFTFSLDVPSHLIATGQEVGR